MSVLQNKRVRIGIGIGAVVLAAAAIGLGSYAAFSDVETGPSGTQASGTLDLVLGGSSPATLFNATNIAPGYTQDIQVVLNNVGSLPGNLTSTIQVADADVTCTEPERVQENIGTTAACAGNLGAQMQVSIAPPGTPTTFSNPVVLDSLSSLPAVQIPANGSVTYTMRFTFPNVAGTVNNAAQGDSVTVTSNFTLAQV